MRHRPTLAACWRRPGRGWKNSYVVSVNGQPAAEWKGPAWRTPGGVIVAGEFFPVEAARWANRFTMFDRAGMPIGLADHVGRRDWTAFVDGRHHQFRRPSLFGTTMLHVGADRDVGWLRRKSSWTGGIEAELPTLSLLAQVFIAGAVLTTWDRRAAAAS